MIQIYNFCQKIYIFQKIVYVTYCKCERRMHGKQSNCNWLRIVRRIGFVEEQPHFRKKVVNVPKISIKTRCDPFKAHINWKQHNTFGKWYDHLDFDGRKKKVGHGHIYHFVHHIINTHLGTEQTLLWSWKWNIFPIYAWCKISAAQQFKICFVVFDFIMR